MKKILLTVLGIVFVILRLNSAQAARELPVLVEMEALSQAYDYRRVTIQTWIRAGREVRTRRLDGQYTELRVGSHDGRALVVVLNERLYGRVVDRCATIQGVYRRGGRFGGFLMDADFLIADAIVIDLSGEMCRREGD